jgi:hypothetical protein
MIRYQIIFMSSSCAGKTKIAIAWRGGFYSCWEAGASPVDATREARARLGLKQEAAEPLISNNCSLSMLSTRAIQKRVGNRP